MREPIGVGQPALAAVAVQTAVAEAPVAMATIVRPEPAAELPPATPRFMSEDEEDEAEPEIETAEPQGVVMAAAAPPQARIADTAAFDALFVEHVPLGPARPKFAELCEEPAFKPLPRDYATDFGTGVRPATADDRQPVGALFADKADDGDRDLEVPTFMRRVQF
jgi:hypothetical protein